VGLPQYKDAFLEARIDAREDINASLGERERNRSIKEIDTGGTDTGGETETERWEYIKG
jgi:hypothetical protein